MIKRNRINIAKSSIIGLQAELVRKQDEASQCRNQNRTRSSKLELKSHIVSQLTKVKRKKTEQPKPFTNDEEESEILNQSRTALLAKSRLYDKLRNKELSIDDPDQFLIDFNQNDGVSNNEKDEDSDSDSEWVTFVDSLGRSRTCLRTDLKYYKKLDSDISIDVCKDEKPVLENKESNEQIAMMSEEMVLWEQKREQLRKQWEEEEKRLNEKKDIHYQDVLFDEARTHGVGYFHFSKDEAERQREQEELNRLRDETTKNQMISMSIKERRQQQMKQRIEAAKKRKRERLGLPPEAEEGQEEELSQKQDEKKNEDQESKEELAKKIEELLKDVERSRHIRPWDIGKDGGNPSPVMSQEKWNEKQRAVRVQEFAPPLSYFEKKPEERGGLYFSSKRKKRLGFGHTESKSFSIEAEYDIEEINLPTDSKSDKKGTEIPPPLSYEKDRLPGKLKMNNLNEAFEMGLNRLKQNSELKNKNKNKSLLDIE